jgi:hypothetical protein
LQTGQTAYGPSGTTILSARYSPQLEQTLNMILSHFTKAI